MAEESGAEYVRERRDGWDLWLLAGWPADECWAVVRDALSGSRPPLAVSRHARTTVVEVPSAGGPTTAYLKSYHTADWRASLKDLVRESKAVRAWQVSRQLAAQGFSVPLVAAVGERRRMRRVRGAFLLTIGVEAPTLQSVAGVGVEGEPGGRALLEALGAEVGRLHAGGWVAGDLLVTNILVEMGPPPRFWFIDHDRTRRAVSWEGERPFRRNLVQLDRLAPENVTAADRRLLFDAYARTRGWKPAQAEKELGLLGAAVRRRAAFLKRRALSRGSR